MIKRLVLAYTMRRGDLIYIGDVMYYLYMEPVKDPHRDIVLALRSTLESSHVVRLTVRRNHLMEVHIPLM